MLENWPWDDREILRYMGFRGRDVPENIRELAASGRRDLERTAAPKSFWQEFSLELAGDEITIGGRSVKSRSLGRNLKDCDRILLFGATLGSGVDVLLARYGKLEMSRAVAVQAASVAMLETYCDQENQKIKDAYEKKGLYLRPRFSPGYGDFPLEFQEFLVSALALPKRIGVTLTRSLLMAPSKSVTAVIGVSPLPKNCSIQGCEVCAKARDCLYRR